MSLQTPLAGGSGKSQSPVLERTTKPGIRPPLTACTGQRHPNLNRHLPAPQLSTSDLKPPDGGQVPLSSPATVRMVTGGTRQRLTVLAGLPPRAPACSVN